MSEKEKLVRKMRLLCNAMGQMHDELLGCRVAPLIRRPEPFDVLLQEAREILDKALDDFESIVSYLMEEIEKEPPNDQVVHDPDTGTGTGKEEEPSFIAEIH